jgi:hypothetical protein
MNILSTWGDPYYVGLMGLEVFDHTGHLVTLENVQQVRVRGGGVGGRCVCVGGGSAAPLARAVKEPVKEPVKETAVPVTAAALC